MPANITIKDEDGTVAFSYTGKSVLVNDIVTAAAHYLYNTKPKDPNAILQEGEKGWGKEFNDLSIADKLDLVDEHLKRVLTDLAFSYTVNAATDKARETATAEALSTISFESLQ